MALFSMILSCHDSVTQNSANSRSASPLRPGGISFQNVPGEDQTCFLQFLSGLPISPVRLHIPRLFGIVIAIDRIMPAFDGQIRIISGSKQGMDNLPPVALAEPDRTVLRPTGTANTIPHH